MKSLWPVSALALLLLTASPARAADDPRCLIDPIRFGCDVGGDGPGDENPWSDTKEWASWDDGGACVSDGLGGRWIYRLLLWVDGPNASTPVRRTDVGGVVGAEVPYAPPRWDGSAATFGPDGLVRDTACLTAGWEFAAQVWELVPGGRLAVDPTVRGLVGLDTWLWWDGDTTVGPLVMDWTDPNLGVGLQLQVRARADRFWWQIGSHEQVTAGPGSGDDLPASAAVTHVFETTGEIGITVDVRWVGEHRVRLAGDAWGDWLPIPGEARRSDSLPYPVIEVRSGLIGN